MAAMFLTENVNARSGLVAAVLLAQCVFAVSQANGTIQDEGWCATPLVGNSTSGLLEVIQRTENTIGYAGFDSVVHQEVDVNFCSAQKALMVNKAGRVVEISAASIEAAFRSSAPKFSTNDCPGFGLCANLYDGGYTDAWPIATLTYVIVPGNATEEDDGCEIMRAVYNYVKWIIVDEEAREIARGLGFAPLPTTIASDVLNIIEEEWRCWGSDGVSRRMAELESTVTQIRGSGSSLQGNLQTELSNAYFQSHFVSVSYNPTSSGTGRAALRNFEDNFAGSDSVLDMSDPEFIRREMKMVPLFGAGIAVLYNLPGLAAAVPAGQEARLVLSRAMLNDIFLGRITAWNHPQVLEANTALVGALPSEAILRVVRGRKSGTTSAFTQTLYHFEGHPSAADEIDYSLHALGGSGLPAWPMSELPLPEGTDCVLRTCNWDECAAGYFLSRSTADCTPCPPGQFSPLPGQQTECQPCPAGSTPAPERDRCDPCPPGYYAADAGSLQCLACGRSGFASRAGMTQCEACGEHREMPEEVAASSDQSDCRCRAGYVMGCKFQIWQVLVVVLALVALLNCGVLLYCKRARKRDAEQRTVDKRIKRVRAIMSIRREDGWLLPHESRSWAQTLTLTNIRRLNLRAVENLARMTLMLPFDVEALDYLASQFMLLDSDKLYTHTDTHNARAPSFRLLREEDVAGTPWQRLCDFIIHVSCQLLDPDLHRASSCGVSRPALARPSRLNFREAGGGGAGMLMSHTVADVPTLVEQSGALLIPPNRSTVDRFDFFVSTVARLKLWGHEGNFQALKDEVQAMMNGLRATMDKLYDVIVEEPEGADLVSFSWEAPAAGSGERKHAGAVCRQDHSKVMAIRVDTQALVEMEMQQQEAPDERRLSIVRDKRTLLERVPSSLSRLRHHSGSEPRTPSPESRTHAPPAAPPSLLAASAVSPPSPQLPPVEELQLFPRRSLPLDGDAMVVADLVTCNPSAPRNAAVNPNRPPPAPPGSPPRRGSLTDFLFPRHSLHSDGNAAPAILGDAEAEEQIGAGAEPKPKQEDSVFRSIDERQFIDQLFLRARLLDRGFQQQVRFACALQQLQSSHAEGAAQTAHRRIAAARTFVGPLDETVTSEEGVFGTSFGGVTAAEATGEGDWEPELQVHSGAVKSIRRMTDKVNTYAEEAFKSEDGKHCWPQLPLTALILDPVRASVICPNPATILKVARWMIESGDKSGLPVVRIKNKFSVNDSAEYDGYRDLMLSVLYTGVRGLRIIGEIQLHDARMHPLKVKMHRLYKVKRAVTAQSIC